MEAAAAPRRTLDRAASALAPAGASPASPAPSAPAAVAAPAPARPGTGAAPAPEAGEVGPDTGAPGPGRAAAPWVITTYFAEGLPYSIVHKFVSELFTAMGASNAAIGLLSLYGLAWNFKFLWSPLVDVVGTKRRWLLATQLLLAAALVALAIPAAQGAPGLMTVGVGLVLVAVLAATQDIAVDGFYLQALDKPAQSRLSGLRVGAYRGALLVGGSLLVKLAAQTSWSAAFVAAGGMLALLAVLHAAFLPRPASAAPAPAPRAALPVDAPWLRYADAFLSFLRQPRIALVLAFILVYRAGDALMFAQSTPFLKWLGLDTDARANLGFISLGVSIAGSMLGGVVVARWELRRTLFPIALVQSLAIPLFVLLAWLRPSWPGITALVVLEQFAAGVGTTGLMVFLMRCCKGEYKAAHFAVASALMSVAATSVGSVSGFIQEQVGYPVLFTIAFAASIPGVILSRHVPTD